MNLVMTGASKVTGRSYITLLVLARYADDGTGECWPGMRAISFMARQSIRTTVRAVEKLADAGWVEVSRKAGRGGCNRYTLALERLDSESVRRAKPIPSRPLKAHVQKPVEKLRKSCGRSVEKPGAIRPQSANSGNGIIRESLEKTEKTEKTEATAAGQYAPSLHDSRRSPDILAVLKRLNRSLEAEPRSRGSPFANRRPEEFKNLNPSQRQEMGCL